MAKNIIYESLKYVFDLLDNPEQNNDLICDNKIYNYVSTMKYDHFTKYINKITKQECLDTKYNYNEYTFDCITKKICHIKYSSHVFDDPYHNSIYLNRETQSFVIRIIEPNIMLNILDSNTKSRYCFFPITFKVDEECYYHQSVLIFDMFIKKAYFVDPDGTITYFNPVDVDDDKYFHYEHCINDFITEYILYISEQNTMTPYIFSHLHEWNAERYIVNRDFTNCEIEYGHCVSTTLLIMHLMVENEIDPEIVFDIIYMLSNTELLSLINDYSVYIYKSMHLYNAD